MKKIITLTLIFCLSVSLFGLPHKIIQQPDFDFYMENDPIFQEFQKKQKGMTTFHYVYWPITGFILGLVPAILVSGMFEDYEVWDDDLVEYVEADPPISPGLAFGLTWGGTILTSVGIAALFHNSNNKSIMQSNTEEMHFDTTLNRLVEPAIITKAYDDRFSNRIQGFRQERSAVARDWIRITPIVEGYLAETAGPISESFDKTAWGSTSTPKYYFASIDKWYDDFTVDEITLEEYEKWLEGEMPSQFVERFEDWVSPEDRVLMSNLSSDSDTGPIFETGFDQINELTSNWQNIVPVPVENFDIFPEGSNYYTVEVPSTAIEGLITLPEGNFYVGQLAEGYPVGKGHYGNWIDGRLLEVNLVEGIPSGSAFYTVNGEEQDVEFSGGQRNLKNIIDLDGRLRDLNKLKNEVAAKLSSIDSLEDLTDLAIEIGDIQRSLEKDLGPEDLLSKFSNDPNRDSIRTSDGTTWSLVSITENIIRDESGKVIQIHRDGTMKGDGFEWTRTVETATFIENEKKSVFSGNSLLGGNLTVAPGIFTFGGQAGINLRTFSNSGKLMPDTKGGKGGGIDLRASADFSASIINISILDEAYTYASGNLRGYGQIGYSWFNFEKMNQETLQQPGKGFSLGLQLGYSYPVFSSDDYNPTGSYIIAPAMSWEKYDYNPATVDYQCTSTTLMFFPFPFMISLSVSNSFF